MRFGYFRIACSAVVTWRSSSASGMVVAQRDRAAGRVLIDAHITDPELRPQAEQIMSANREGAIGIMSSQGIATGANGAFFVPRIPPQR